MKFIILCLFIFSSYISFGQMTLFEIQKVYKMNFDQFEEFALSKGYHFEQFMNDENLNGITYVKGVGKNTKYLTLYDKQYNYKKNVNYQTCDTKEILNLKKQLKISGFKIHDTFFIKGGIKIEKYRNDLFEFIFYTVPPNNELPFVSNESFVSYEIGYNKILE